MIRFVNSATLFRPEFNLVVKINAALACCGCRGDGAHSSRSRRPRAVIAKLEPVATKYTPAPDVLLPRARLLPLSTQPCRTTCLLAALTRRQNQRSSSMVATALAAAAAVTATHS
jgi:hypothetical protein